jgi:hypothetical protein
MKIGRQPRKWLAKKAKGGFRGYPLGSIAFYGPDDKRASKAAVGIFAAEGAEPTMRKWFSETEDVHTSEEIGEAIATYLRDNGVRSVAMADRIMGCPHEEEVDYPLGESCPHCPFWANRDRFTGEMIT